MFGSSLAVGLAALLLSPSHSLAITTCDLGAGVLEVALSANGDLVTIRRQIGGDEIRLSDRFDNTVTCTGGTPTVANTNALNVHNAPGLHGNSVLLLFPERLEPGLNTVGENGGTPEIEVFVNLNDGDTSLLRVVEVGRNLVLGAGGINANADGEAVPDADILPLGVPLLEGMGDDFPDLISAAGGSGTGGPAPAGVRLLGEGDGDTIVGGSGDDLLEGGPGDDDVEGGAGDDELLGGTGGDDLSGGEGGDRIESGSNGGPAPERLAGGAGDDELLPGAVEDEVLGGPGLDVAGYRRIVTGVTIEMSSLPGIETLIGTDRGDVLGGDAGPNAISGQDGDDVIVGRGGEDTVRGGAGDDEIDVRDGGPDLVDCGDGIDSVSIDRAGVDALVACETVLPPPGDDGDEGGDGPDGGPGGGVSSSRVPARLSGFRLEPVAFAAAARGRSVISSRRKRARHVGSTVRYRLSRPAKVRFTVERRRVRRCRTKGRSRRHCSVRRLLRGSFRHAGREARNRFTFSGRLRGRKLRPGRYVLIATPTNADGKSSKPRRARFRILPPSAAEAAPLRS